MDKTTELFRPSVTEAVSRKAYYESEVRRIQQDKNEPIPEADKYVKAIILAKKEVKAMYLLGMVDATEVQEEIYRHYHAHLDNIEGYNT